MHSLDNFECQEVNYHSLEIYIKASRTIMKNIKKAISTDEASCDAFSLLYVSSFLNNGRVKLNYVLQFLSRYRYLITDIHHIQLIGQKFSPVRGNYYLYLTFSISCSILVVGAKLS